MYLPLEDASSPLVLLYLVPFFLSMCAAFLFLFNLSSYVNKLVSFSLKTEDWEVQEGGNIWIPLVDSCCCMAETNTML